MRLTHVIFTVAVFCFASAHAVAGEQTQITYKAASPCQGAFGCDDFFNLTDGLKLPIYRNYDLAKPNKNIARAVVVIHGNSRNGDTYFSNMMDAAVKAKAERNVLVVAPNFYVDEDKFFRKKGEVYWDSGNRWKKGNKSTRDYDHRISSFAAVDLLLAHVAKSSLFPNLQIIVIVGHSAGGQFVQRYSLGHKPNSIHEKIHLRFIVANPGRYFYFNEYRVKANYKNGFEVPKNVENCAYNRYEYGMEKRNSYMNQGPPRMMIDRYRKRDVILIIGENDNDTDARSLNVNCKSMLQGRHRFERAVIFKRHLDTFFSPHKTRFFVIPGVGHSSRDMFHSARGLSLIFH